MDKTAKLMPSGSRHATTVAASDTMRGNVRPKAKEKVKVKETVAEKDGKEEEKEAGQVLKEKAREKEDISHIHSGGRQEGKQKEEKEERVDQKEGVSTAVAHTMRQIAQEDRASLHKRPSRACAVSNRRQWRVSGKKWEREGQQRQQQKQQQ